nr:MAG TPA: hypothetical protein [Caudoviricetes sp.]
MVRQICWFSTDQQRELHGALTASQLVYIQKLKMTAKNVDRIIGESN